MERKNMEKKHCVNAAVYTKYGTSVRGIAAPIKENWLAIESENFIRPGTEVDTVLFCKEPRRVAGEVRWTLAEPTEDRIVYKMGLWVPDKEPVA
jgi:hypothetical protein